MNEPPRQLYGHMDVRLAMPGISVLRLHRSDSSETSGAPAPAPGQPAAPSPIDRPRATPQPTASLSPPQHAELLVGNPVSPAQMDGLPFDRGRFSVSRGQKRSATQ